MPMNLANRFNNWPPAIAAHHFVTSRIDHLADRLNSRTSKVFSPIGNWCMQTYLGLKPHSDGATACFVCLAFCLFGLAFYINSLP